MPQLYFMCNAFFLNFLNEKNRIFFLNSAKNKYV